MRAGVCIATLTLFGCSFPVDEFRSPDDPDASPRADTPVTVTDSVAIDAAGSDTPQSCAVTEKRCGMVCADVQNDGRNCGDCGRRCDSGESCRGGKCR